MLSRALVPSCPSHIEACLRSMSTTAVRTEGSLMCERSRSFSHPGEEGAIPGGGLVMSGLGGGVGTVIDMFSMRLNSSPMRGENRVYVAFCERDDHAFGQAARECREISQ